MSTDGHRLRKKPILKEESDELLGLAMEVHNEVGYGFHEKPYENAVVVECRLRGIAVDQQKRYPLEYKGESIGLYIPDLIVFDSIIVDTKVIDQITNHEIGQMMNYLRISGLKLGYILNFKHPRLQWKRVVLCPPLS
jgi:GxxExxY protein